MSGSRKTTKAKAKVEAAPFASAITGNHLTRSEGSRKRLIHIDAEQTNPVEAEAASLDAHIYMSPVFASVRDCVILTGDAAEKHREKSLRDRAEKAERDEARAEVVHLRRLWTEECEVGGALRRERDEARAQLAALREAANRARGNPSPENVAALDAAIFDRSAAVEAHDRRTAASGEARGLRLAADMAETHAATPTEPTRSTQQRRKEKLMSDDDQGPIYMVGSSTDGAAASEPSVESDAKADESLRADEQYMDGLRKGGIFSPTAGDIFSPLLPPLSNRSALLLERQTLVERQSEIAQRVAGIDAALAPPSHPEPSSFSGAAALVASLRRGLLCSPLEEGATPHARQHYQLALAALNQAESYLALAALTYNGWTAARRPTARSLPRASEQPASRLPVIPATCGECSLFDPWNDGTCGAADPEMGEWVNAEKKDAPPHNCPKRKACPARRPVRRDEP